MKSEFPLLMTRPVPDMRHRVIKGVKDWAIAMVDKIKTNALRSQTYLQCG